MMICPLGYEESHENDTFEELIKERNFLIKEIKYFEQNMEELMHGEIKENPSPDLCYVRNLEYLSIICWLLIKKIKKEY